MKKIVQFFCSLVLQIWGMDLLEMVIILSTLQIMTFFLRTVHSDYDSRDSGKQE